jgi:hypothetical protein
LRIIFSSTLIDPGQTALVQKSLDPLALHLGGIDIALGVGCAFAGYLDLDTSSQHFRYLQNLDFHAECYIRDSTAPVMGQRRME